MESLPTTATSRTPPLATRRSRLGAALIDWFLYAVVVVAGVLITLLGADFWGIAATVACCAALALYQLVLIARSGQTLAKRWLGLRIVKTDGAPAGFVSGVLLRIGIPVATATALQVALWGTGFDFGAAPLAFGGQLDIGLFGMVSLLPIFGPRRRALHDYIAGTIVVAEPPDPVRLRQIRFVTVSAVLLFGTSGGVIGLWRFSSCRGPSADCDGNFWNGCEASLATTWDCGACGSRCSETHGDATCSYGRCHITCFRGFADCDGDVANGCEAELLTSNEHCGACGKECKGRCSEGGCERFDVAPEPAHEAPATTGAALPKGTVLLAGVGTHGPVTGIQFRQGVHREQRALERCYGEALVDHPALRAELGIRLVISRDGTVSNYSVTKTIASPALTQCVSTVLYRLIVDESQQITTVNFTLRFTPDR